MKVNITSRASEKLKEMIQKKEQVHQNVRILMTGIG